MSLRDKIRDDMNAARRDRDKARTMLLNMTLSEMKNKEIDLKRDLTDPEVVDVVQKAIKRRREAAEQMRAGARVELAEKEEQEATLLASYLPPQMTEDDVRALIREAIA